MLKALKRLSGIPQRKNKQKQIVISLLYRKQEVAKKVIQELKFLGGYRWILLPIPLPDEATENWQLPRKRLEMSDAIIFVVNGEGDSRIKKDRAIFWEKVIWDSITKEMPITSLIYNSESYGSLNEEEIIEYLSLVRLSDRFWSVFQLSLEKEKADEVVSWMERIVKLVGVKDKSEWIEAIEEEYQGIQKIIETKKLKQET